MKLYQLESILDNVKTFSDPKTPLEQYPTSSHLASIILHTASTTFDDIEDKVVCDLGCGTGIFTIGAVLLGASHVFGVDIDGDALSTAKVNVENVEEGVGDRVEFVQGDALDGLFCLGRGGDGDGEMGGERGMERVVDTVIMNPPFGTRNKGVDMAFLRVAFEISGMAVYSLHKSSTREYIQKKTSSWNARPEVLAELRFDIPQMYAHHRQASLDIEVDLWRFDVSNVKVQELPSPRALIGDVSGMDNGNKRSRPARGRRRGRGSTMSRRSRKR